MPSPTIPDDLAPSTGAILAIKRGMGKNNPSYYNYNKFTAPEADPSFGFNRSSRGFLVGSGKLSRNRDQKEGFAPSIQYNAQLTVGALLNVLGASGYIPLNVGNAATSTPIATTISGAVTTRHAKVVTLASTTGININDVLQFGSISGVPPVVTDTCETHKIASVGATSAVQYLFIQNATGGTFTISYGGQTTAAIAYNATASAIQTAIQAMSSVGASNALVAAITTPYTGFSITFAGTLASTYVATMTTSSTALTGTGVTDTTNAPFAAIYDVTFGCAANQVALAGRLLFTYASGVAVIRVDPNAGFTTYWLHAPYNSPLRADFFNNYFSFGSATATFLQALFTDGLSASFAPAPKVGQIPTAGQQMKFRNVTFDPATMFIIANNLVTDPSDVTVTNTQGNFSMLGDTVNAAEGVNFNMVTEMYVDYRITQLIIVNLVHLSHELGIGFDSPFVRNYFNQIVRSSGTQTGVSAAIPEAPFTFVMQSPVTVGTTTNVYHSISLNAPDTQYADYNPKLSTNQPVMGTMGGAEVVRQAGTDTERWYWTSVSNCTTDTYSAS